MGVYLIGLDNEDRISLWPFRQRTVIHLKAGISALLTSPLVLESVLDKTQRVCRYYTSPKAVLPCLLDVGVDLVCRFRDAKEFIGLTQSQDVAKRFFIFNMSLTTVNIAEVPAKEKDVNFSMSSFQSMILNTCLLGRFIDVSGIKPNRR